MSIEDYRAGFRAGYFWGRLDKTDDKPYDDRTPGEKGTEDNAERDE